MISTLFGKKRISEDKLANMFVNALFVLTENGFPNVAAELNESPEFEGSPEISPQDDTRFTLIVLTGNLMELPRQLPSGQDKRIRSLALSKFAQAVGLTTSEVEAEVDRLRSLMDRLNYPSKRTVYAMSKALFQEYDLLRFQTSYFREMKAPNPIILKRLNGLMECFLWDWSEFGEQYRIAS